MKLRKLRRSIRRAPPRSVGLEQLESRHLLAAVSIVASQDNSLFEDNLGSKSNGSGDFLFAGRTNQPPGSSLRRALVAFELQDKIPEGATIQNVQLSLHLSKTISEEVFIGAHRVVEPWGESTSHASGPNEGRGGTAAPGDATWLHRSFPNTSWTNDGGDFVSTASATTAVGAVQQAYVWSSQQMIADVEAWLQNPQENFGWILVGGEQAMGTAKRFHARESTDAAKRPMLIVEFEEATLPTIVVEDASILESDTSTSMVFNVSISAPPAQPATVRFETLADTAQAVTDFTATAGTLTFSPNGPLSQTVTVPVIGDEVTEADETFLLQLSNAVNSSIGDGQAVGTILNDDPLPSLSIGDISLPEGNGQTTIVEVPVQLSHPSAFAVTVAYETVAATAGEDDFVAASATLTFAPGETSKNISVSVLADEDVEEDEQFTILLSAPVNAALADAEATISIVNDDVLTMPWQNKDLVWDVTGDGAVVPRDVLVIINYINANGSGPLPPPGPNGPPPFYDVTGDGEISPRDALVVINFINANNQAVGEPDVEGVDRLFAWLSAAED